MMGSHFAPDEKFWRLILLPRRDEFLFVREQQRPHARRRPPREVLHGAARLAQKWRIELLRERQGAVDRGFRCAVVEEIFAIGRLVEYDELDFLPAYFRR